MTRTATIDRKTNETEISLKLDLDGSGTSRISTCVGFLDHMLELLARHAVIDLDVTATECAGQLQRRRYQSYVEAGILGANIPESRCLGRWGQARQSHRRASRDVVALVRNGGCNNPKSTGQA